ncbi:MAG: glycosyltransferase, partial [Solirubrobacteraceae bacterium]
LELSRTLPSLDLESETELWVLATHLGVPVAKLYLPGIGRCPQTASLLAAVVRREVAAAIAFAQTARQLEARIAGAAAGERLTVSVVVCTHRRPRSLAVLLAALRELEPRPDEIVVVDNAPGTEDCRKLVEESGARYVREDVQGLDVARVSGVRAARGQIVAFTDDDVVPAPGWLERVPELFADPAVGCVVGPVLPLRIATDAQRNHELYAPLNRGFARRDEDWTTLRAGFAPDLGVGANMLLRRTVIRFPERAFPPELGAGTASQAGDDGYALYRCIVDGWRVIYDPATHVFHDHRREDEAFARAVRGYGIGLGCWTATVLARDRDPTALSLGLITLSGYLRTCLAHLAGEADRDELRVARRMVRGLLESPPHLLKARRVAAGLPTRLTGHLDRAADPVVVGSGPHEARGRSKLSVMLIGPRREDLDVRVFGDHSRVAEVIWLPEASDHSVADWMHAITQATGDAILFWDPTSECRKDFIEAHAAAHDATSRLIAVGDLEAVCGDDRLASRLRCREVLAHAANVRSGDMTVLDVGEVNVSISRALMPGIGGLDAGFGLSPAQGIVISASLAGASLRRVPVCSSRDYRATFESLMAAQRQLGRLLARPASRHATITSALSERIRSKGCPRRSDRLLSSLPAIRAFAVLLSVLERCRMRRLWFGAVEPLLDCSFRSGVASGNGPALPDAVTPTTSIELTSSDDLRLGALRGSHALVREAGRVVGNVWISPRADRHEAARTIAAAIEPEFWARRSADAFPDEAIDPTKLPSTTILVAGPAAGPLADPSPARVTVAGLPTGVGERDWWTAADAAIRTCTTEVAALPLPGRSISVAWTDEVLLALSGSSIGMAAGVGLDDHWPAQAIKLLWKGRGGDSASFEPVWVDFIAVRPEAYVSAGGFDLGHCTVGHQYPPCELLHRFLRRGGKVAWTVAPGIVADVRGAADGDLASVQGVIHGVSVG